MKKWNSISLCGVEWNGWICGLWGGAHLRHTTPFHQIFQFDFISAVLLLLSSFAVTQEKKTSNPINQTYSFQSLLVQWIFSFLYSLRNEQLGKWKRKKGGRLGPKPITNYPAIWNSLNFNGGSRRKQPFFPFTSQKREKTIQQIDLFFIFFISVKRRKVLFSFLCWIKKVL